MASFSQAGTETRIVLGKRKHAERVDNYVLHLSSDVEANQATCSEFELSANEASTSQKTLQPVRPTLIVNGKLLSYTRKKYQCVHPGCDKAYSKPSRLEEHERSHSGVRPFECPTCHKTYLRDTHLQAHSRSHLPESARPLACPELNCSKRFWTSQHLRVHAAFHAGTKAFACPEAGCDEAFSKHYQLRQHTCTVHALPGTKPFPCEFQGCGKSFDTNQHLRSHSKTHDDKRYTCIKPACLTAEGNEPAYFPNWTTLQHHMRTAHPPTCLHPSCNNKTFASHKGLRAHQKIHSQREVDEQIREIIASDMDDDDGEPPAPKKQRRGGEYGRDWICDIAGCSKDFKSKKALTTHKHVTHLGHRDFVCSRASCGRAFGYKHLLQRHIAKLHNKSESSSSGESSGEETAMKPSLQVSMAIEDITGLSYAADSRAKLESGESLGCPYPNLDSLSLDAMLRTSAESPNCDYVFRRAYDLRRHLKATHDVKVDKERVDNWVKRVRMR